MEEGEEEDEIWASLCLELEPHFKIFMPFGRWKNSGNSFPTFSLMKQEKNRMSGTSFQ